MKLINIFLFLSILIRANSQSFENYFSDSTLLVDLQHYGTNQTEGYALQSFSKKNGWDASKNVLMDRDNYGNHSLKLYDSSSENLIYSRNYCSLFNEWQSTQEATFTTKSFGETLCIPLPKAPIRMELFTRNREGKYEKAFTQLINPQSIQIAQREKELAVQEISIGGSSDAIDIVILSEGYAEGERVKFENGCAKFSNALFSYSPFKERKHKFNVRSVWNPSKESGASDPGKGVWKQTSLNAQFWTFDSERYLMVSDQQKVVHAAHSAPCEFIYILVNTDKYGGGGIYNFYAIGAASHPKKAEKVHVHEFGHLFLGLADEYDGDASVSDFYPDGVEPWEENITRLIGFESKDWSRMMKKNTPIPTPISRKLSEGAVGVFEGAGYLKNGIYRPSKSCMMRDLVEFCPVCQKAILSEIDRLTQ